MSRSGMIFSVRTCPEDSPAQLWDALNCPDLTRHFGGVGISGERTKAPILAYSLSTVVDDLGSQWQAVAGEQDVRL